VMTSEQPDYEQARTEIVERTQRDALEVLGKLGGEPTWLQGDETPACPACGHDMRFVAQLEEGPDWKTAMNFGGGGWAYVFQCAECESSAAMLWQS